MQYQSPFQFRTFSAKNRIVVPPMASSTADLDGYVTSKTLEHYQRLSLAKPGIHFVEYTFAHNSGRSERNQLGIQSDSHIEGHQKLVEVLKQNGAIAALQLTHAGGKSNLELTGGEFYGPSAVQVPTIQGDLPIPTALPLNAIEKYQEDFLQGAIRAEQAGYDMVELHSAHGYGLNQWLSPLTNIREDQYGGNLENRMRMLLEIVSKIRTRIPHLLISVRIPGQDLVPGGLSIEDAVTLGNALAKSGVDLLDVSSGMGGWRRPRDRRGQGYLIPEAAYIQARTELPVIGVGGIQDIEFVEAQIQKGSISFAAIGRAFLEDPLRFTA